MPHSNFFQNIFSQNVHPSAPINETERLAALASYDILDTPPEPFFEDITHLAAYIFKTPIALISFIDSSRQWYKSKLGISGNEISRQLSFCAHAILQPNNVMVVSDPSSDLRFANNPLVQSTPGIRFYAGVPIVTAAGEALGTLCVIDTQSHDGVGEHEFAALRNLARQIMVHLDIRKSLADMQNCKIQLSEIQQHLFEESTLDELTKLNNRRGFDQSLHLEWERTFRHSNSLSLLLFEADQFRRYREEFGSAVCDEALLDIAAVITQGARKLDVIARFDDEFAVLLPETNSKGAQQIAERIRSKIEQHRWPNRSITLSVGVSSYNGMQLNYDALLIDARRLMLKAQQSGGNCVMYK